MDIIIETTRISSRNNKDQRGDSFIIEKRKVKRATPELDDFVLHEQLKSLMYIDRSLRGDSMKYNFIDGLNFKIFLCLRRNKTSKLFVGNIYQNKSLLFILNFLMPTI